MGCSAVGVSTESLTCHLQETGCLFDLESDACEHHNVGAENTEVRDALIARLDIYESLSATILIKVRSIAIPY